MVGQFFNTMIVASRDNESTSFPETLGTRLIKSGYNDPSKSK